MSFRSPYFDPEKRHKPQTLGEIEDFLAGVFGHAPKFVDDYFDFIDIDSEFAILADGFGRVRAKLGEEHFAKLTQLALEAKALFSADPEGVNGQTDQGFKRLMQIANILREVRTQRSTARLRDEEGEVTGD